MRIDFFIIDKLDITEPLCGNFEFKMNLGQEILNKFEDKKSDSFKFCQLVKEEHEVILKSSAGVKAIREKKRGFKEFV